MNGIRMPLAKTRTATSGYGITFRHTTMDDFAGGDRLVGRQVPGPPGQDSVARRARWRASPPG